MGLLLRLHLLGCLLLTELLLLCLLLLLQTDLLCQCSLLQGYQQSVSRTHTQSTLTFWASC